MADGIGQQPVNFKPSTTDLLSTNRFRVVIGRFPSVNYFTQRVPIPSIVLGQTRQFTNAPEDIKWPGDKIEYDDLLISFIIDENLAGMVEIIAWIQQAGSSEMGADVFSDITIVTLTNNSNANKTFTFHNAWPQTVSSFTLDTTQNEDQPLTADVIFKFSHFTLT